jgi:hypothetical protein
LAAMVRDIRTKLRGAEVLVKLAIATWASC